MATTYGYARVSTQGQDLAEQRGALVNHGVMLPNLFTDKMTGRRMDRPGLTKLLAQLQPGDQVIITKLDRLGRSTTDVLELIKKLSDRGVGLEAMDQGIRLQPSDKDPINKLLVTILAAFADLERDFIVQRTKEGKAVARKRPGYREGRPKAIVTDRDRKLWAYAQEHSMQAAADLGDISLRTMYRIRDRILADNKNNNG